MSEKRFNRIEDAEIKAQGVQSLPIRPNASSQYGQGGLSGKQLQARFDRLAGYIIKKYNDLVDGLASHDVLDYFKLPEGYELSSLRELLLHITGEHGDLVVESPYIEGKEKVANIIEKLKKNIDICKTSIEGITFEGLPDKPFEGTEAIDLTMDYSKGSVALKSGSTAYLVTEKTYTVDEMDGAVAKYKYEGQPAYDASLRLIHESDLGLTFGADVEYVFVVYNTDYAPAQLNGKFPSVGVYLSENPSTENWILSLSIESIPTKRLDGNFVKMYRHSIYMYTSGNPYFSARSVFISPSSKAINTVEKLCNSPCCWSNQTGGSTVQFMSGIVRTSSAAESEREIHSIGISKDKSLVSVTYITAYTTPLAVNTSMLQFNSTRVSVIDYVTEV